MIRQKYLDASLTNKRKTRLNAHFFYLFNNMYPQSMKKIGRSDNLSIIDELRMYKYKERLRLYKRWPCSTDILNRIN